MRRVCQVVAGAPCVMVPQCVPAAGCCSLPCRGDLLGCGPSALGRSTAVVGGRRYRRCALAWQAAAAASAPPCLVGCLLAA